MSRFLEIATLNPPYDLGLDPGGRAKVQFNIMALKTKSTTFEEELAKILTTAAPATFIFNAPGGNVFCSTGAKIPTPGDGPYLSIVSTGGTQGRRIQSVNGTEYEQPTALIVARATDYVVARAMARAAYDALDVVRNQTVVP